METENDSSLIIKTHDFQAAKESIEKFGSKSNNLPGISRVEETCFGIFKHRVSGEEFNSLVSKLQTHFVAQNAVIMSVIDEFNQVYQAFESLDKDYIAGIVSSIKAAEKVSNEERKDRADIRRLVEGHEKSVAVLKRFKQEIEKLKHISDVDRAWELISKQAKAIAELETYKVALLRLSHLKDVDVIWEQTTGLQESLAKFKRESEKCNGEVQRIMVKRDNIAYVIAGVSGLLAIVQLILLSFLK